jgi:hypothetical protein
MAMTARDYAWLARVFAVLAARWIQPGGDEEAYDYFVERLAIKYGNLDEAKFRAAYEEQRLMIR